VYYGNIGEIVSQEVLRKQGFEVWLPRPLAGSEYLNLSSQLRMKRDSVRKRYENNLRIYYDNKPSIIKEKETWEEFLDRHKEGYMIDLEFARRSQAFFGESFEAFNQYLKKLTSESIIYYFDLIAKKEDKIYVIEVKSTKTARRFLRGEKLRGLMLAKDYGFIPALITLELKVEATDFKMKEL
jgi:hypothetical protein